MLIVNLFGAPSAGKSTLAMLVSGFLKTRHPQYTVEFPFEFTKGVVYDEAPKALNCQLYITGCQWWQIARCEGHADVVICDSPILMASVYGSLCDPPMPPEWHVICKQHHDHFPSINYFVERSHAFESKARAHSEAESDLLAEGIKSTLDSSGVKYTAVVSNESSAGTIAGRVASKLNKIKANDYV